VKLYGPDIENASYVVFKTGSASAGCRRLQDHAFPEPLALPRGDEALSQKPNKILRKSARCYGLATIGCYHLQLVGACAIRQG
jgi:hypothetical protein